VIGGYTDLLLHGLPADAPQQELLLEVRGAGDRAAGLTRQLLAFSRKRPLDPRAVGVNALVRDAARLLGRLIGEDVELRLELAPDLGPVFADPGQLEQAVINL